MNLGVALFEFGLLFIFTALLLWYYAVKGIHPVYFVAVLVSWFLGFFGTLLLPIDVEETIERDPLSAFDDLWMFIYWTTFILSWVVLPVLMEFCASGHFGMKARMMDSLRANLKFYAVIGVVGAIIIIWMAISNSWGPSALAGFLMTAANTYGMLLIVVMLGYGLVETPRAVWINSYPDKALARLEYAATELEEQKFDARCNVDECIAEARRLDGMISTNDAQLRHCMDQVMASLPPADVGAVAAASMSGLPQTEASMAAVAKLHTRIKKAVPQLQKLEARWNAMVREAGRLRAVIDKSDEPSEYDSENRPNRIVACWHRLAWFYKSKLNFVLGKVLACFLGLMSALVLWCEFAIPIPADLSLFGLAIAGAKGSFSRQFVAFVPYAYMSWCMYLALFRVKLLSAISLTPNRLSHPYALMFNATYLCRLQFVLAFNYLLLIKTDALDGHSTAFQSSVGSNMELVPLFGTDFNNFIPLLLLIFALATLFRVIDRCVRRIGVEGFGEYVPGRVDHEERRREGQEFIRKSQDRAYRRAGQSKPRVRIQVDETKLARAHELASSIRSGNKRAMERSYTPPSAAARDGDDRHSFFSDIM